MPDVLRVRYLGDSPATVSLVGRLVEPDSVFDVAGRVVVGDDAPGEDADHVLVEVGNPPQTWALPKALYAVESPPKRRAAKTENDTSEGEPV